MLLLKKIKNVFINKKNEGYYKINSSCQIPRLNTIYEMYFSKINNGCFVEVGAYDGEYVSNTSGLADVGWTGFYIEPVPEYYEKCKKRHNRNKSTTVSNLAIGDEKKNATIHLGESLSTIDENMKEKFDNLEWSEGIFSENKIQIAQITLEEYLFNNNIKRNFEVLVIDVEGYEWKVLKPFNINHWNPKMVIIELHDQNNDYIEFRTDHNQIVNYFERNNYKIIYKDFTNTIYVQKDLYPQKLSE